MLVSLSQTWWTFQKPAGLSVRSVGSTSPTKWHSTRRARILYMPRVRWFVRNLVLMQHLCSNRIREPSLPSLSHLGIDWYYCWKVQGKIDEKTFSRVCSDWLCLLNPDEYLAFSQESGVMTGSRVAMVGRLSRFSGKRFVINYRLICFSLTVAETSHLFLAHTRLQYRCVFL